MPKLTDFPGFFVQSAVTIDSSSSNAVGGYNPFAQDTGRVVEKKKDVPPPTLFADLSSKPSQGGKDLSQTLFCSEKPTIEPKEIVEDAPFVALHPAAATATTIAEATTTPPPIAIQNAPMIQPRSKEGQRLLYKHPMCPRVGPKGAYWMLVGQSDKSATAWLMQFDGGANPNPGPTSAGAVLWTPPDLDGKRSVAFEAGKFCGKATNNIGEAQGLLLGLQIAATRGARELLIEGDSELIIFQQTGQYKVSNANLKRWWAEIQAAMMDETCFDWIAIRQVPRELNERADSITKEVLIKKANFTRA